MYRLLKWSARPPPPQPFYGPFFRDHPGEPVPEENFWQGKITEADTHPAGCHSIRTNQCPPPPSRYIFLQTGCPSCRPTNSEVISTDNKTVNYSTVTFSSLILSITIIIYTTATTDLPFSGNWTRYRRLCSFGFVMCAGMYGYYNNLQHIIVGIEN